MVGRSVASVDDLTRVQWILLLNFVVLLLHQFEEHPWLGGEVSASNPAPTEQLTRAMRGGFVSSFSVAGAGIRIHVASASGAEHCESAV